MTKILIVEDEEAISDLIKMSLTKAGYHCEQAMDGLEAADCIENNNYDLILLDIMLPDWKITFPPLWMPGNQELRTSSRARLLPQKSPLHA